jgi:subtilisin family serine protease
MQRPKSYRGVWIALLILAVITPIVFVSSAGASFQGKSSTQNKPVRKEKASTKDGLTAVMIELHEAPGVVHKVAAERAGQRITTKDVAAYSLQLFGKQNALLNTLKTRGLNARLRTEDVRQINGTVRHVEYRFGYLLNGFVAYVNKSDLEQLRAQPEVAGVYEFPQEKFFLDRAIDYSLGTQTAAADRRLAVYGATQELSPLGEPGHPEAPRLTKIDGFEGQGMNLAVIDSGVDYRHPMFGGIGQTTPLPRTSGEPESPDDNRKVIYYYAMSSPGDPTDDFGHGTLVASTAAGYLVDGTTAPRTGYGTGTTGLGVGPTPNGVTLFGMAPQARIMAYKVCGPAPQCPGDIPLSIEDAASPVTLVGRGDGGSVRTMVSKPVADVINLSLGDTSGDPSAPSARAANNAALAGTIVVASAGNSGPGIGTIGSPSAATLAISVAASLDPGSISGADVLAPNQIPLETCDDTPRPPTCDSGAQPAPSPERGATSNANTPQPGERQGIRIFPVAGGGPLPTESNPGQPDNNGPSLSAHYVFVDRRNMATPIPPSVTNRIAVVKFSGAFAAAANSLAPFNPAAILLITAIESATAVVVVNGIPTFTIGVNDGEYLLDRLRTGDDDTVDPPNGAVSELPLRLAESISLSAFQGSMAGFSSRGPNDHPNARFRTIKPDVTGPGVGIQGAATVDGLPDDTVGLASATGYTQANGTSFSGPITAGAVTLVRQRVRELGFDSTDLSATDYRARRYDTVTIARALLQNSATNLRNGFGVPETDPAPSTRILDLGSGHINVAGALAANAIMVSPTMLLTTPREFTAPSASPSPTPFPVLIPTASYGAVPVAGVDATVVRTREVILRDVTNSAGGGAYNLSIEDNRNINQPGFNVSIVATADSTTPITSVTVPAGGQTSFFVRTAVDGNQVTVDPTEFMWYVSATQASSGQKLRMPFYYRAISANLPNIIAPNQAPPTFQIQ